MYKDLRATIVHMLLGDQIKVRKALKMQEKLRGVVSKQ